MKALTAWVLVNALLVAAHLVAAATCWAFGTLMIRFAPALEREWLAWFVVGAIAVGTGIAFLIALTRAAGRGRHAPTV